MLVLWRRGGVGGWGWGGKGVVAGREREKKYLASFRSAIARGVKMHARSSKDAYRLGELQKCSSDGFAKELLARIKPGGVLSVG